MRFEEYLARMEGLEPLSAEMDALLEEAASDTTLPLVDYYQLLDTAYPI